MRIIQALRNTKKHLACLVLMVCFLLMAGVSVYAEEIASVRLPVNQMFFVTGSTLSDEDGIFAYELTAADAETPMPAGSTQEGYQFSLKGNQSLEIGPMTYFDTGIYEYRLELVISNEKTGYVYDKEVYFITVYVKNTQNDGPVAGVIAKNTAGNKVGSLDFKHTYQPLASDPAVMVDPPVKKTVSGNPSDKGTFKFSLTAEEKTNPMPKRSIDGKKVITIQGEGESEFGVWSYTSVGIYRYTVSEEDTGEKGYSYDKTVYTITDVVEDEEGQLIVMREITNSDKKQVDTCTFQNQYTADSFGMDKGAGYTPVKTGDTSNIVLWAIILVIAAMSILGVVKSFKNTHVF